MNGDGAEGFRAGECGEQARLSAVDDKSLKLMRCRIARGERCDAGEEGLRGGFVDALR